MRRRIHMQANHVPRRARAIGIGGERELTTAVRGQPMLAPDAVHRSVVQLHFLRHGLVGPVRRAGGRRGQSTGQHRLHQLRARGGLARRPRAIVQQASTYRSCHRHTVTLPVRRMISIVPNPSAVASTKAQRYTCFCGVSGAATSACRRWPSSGAT